MAKLSLAEFAAKNPRNQGGLKCWACNIAEVEDINEARLRGTTIPTILKWLRDVRGHRDVTMGRLSGHFVNNRHHEKGR